jgi:tetratricopeptide (TPR) repeat protein
MRESRSGMLKRSVSILCGMIGVLPVLAGSFPEDFQSAVLLFRTGKTEEAETAFVQLSGRQVAQRGVDESLAYAATCALALKKPDQALERGGKIKDETLAKLVKMQILRDQRKYAELLELSQNDDFSKWPDGKIYGTLTCRANAYAALKKYENAEKDYRAAIQATLLTEDKGIALLLLGELYRDGFKDNQKAVDTYGEFLKLKDPRIGLLSKAVTSRARLLALQGQGEQALVELIAVQGKPISEPAIIYALRVCSGEMNIALGKTNEALVCYRGAVGVTNAPEALLKEVGQKIADLEKLDQK